MSASRLMQQGDGLSTLKDLLTSIQNPETITSAHETYRREIALTETEEKQVSEARALIKEHQKLLEDLKKANDQHATNQNEMTTRETALAQSQQKFAEMQEAVRVAHLQEVNALAEERKQLTSQIERESERVKSAQKGFDGQVAKFGDEKRAHEAEKLRVANVEKDALALKTKYQKMIEYIQRAPQVD